MSSLHLGSSFPNFQGKASGTADGSIDLYQYLGPDNWGVLFSHPADFTPVCTTELARAVQLKEEFDKLKCKLIALSCNDVESHKAWGEDIMTFAKQGGKPLPFPIVADESRQLAKTLNIMDPDEVDDKTKLPMTCRAVFIINAKKEMRAKVLYPATTGRSFDEILRVLTSLQLTEKQQVATPEGWKVGDKCMVLPTIDDAKAKTQFPKFDKMDVPSGKGYMRFTPQPELA